MCLNGFKNVTYSKKINSKIELNKKIRAGYAILKHYKNKFRKEHGWHTAEGRNNISKARKGKFPAIDASTGEKVGSVDKDHPKVLSGEWVHQTKGWVTVIDERTNTKVRIKTADRKDYHKSLISSAGTNNANFSGLTDDYIIEKSLEFVQKYGVIPSFKLLCIYCSSNNIPMVSSLAKFRFKEYEAPYQGYIKRMEKITGLKYDAFCKSYREIGFKITGASFKNQYSK